MHVSRLHLDGRGSDCLVEISNKYAAKGFSVLSVPSMTSKSRGRRRTRGIAQDRRFERSLTVAALTGGNLQ